MSNKPIKAEYQSPQAEILEVRLERGFVGSSYGGSSTEGIGSGSNYGGSSFDPATGGNAEGIGSGSSYDGTMFT